MRCKKLYLLRLRCLLRQACLQDVEIKVALLRRKKRKLLLVLHRVPVNKSWTW